MKPTASDFTFAPPTAEDRASTDGVLAELDALIASRSILQHPFYQAWTQGGLTPAQLATYARYYFPHVAAFPGHLEAAASGAADPVVRAELLANLREELSEPRPHAELWLAFARGCGLDAEEVAAAPPADGARATVAAFRRLAEGETAGALAGLYAYESQQPEVARTKAEGLRRHYGVEGEPSLAYFTVHQEADLRHRAGERQALARCLETGSTREEVLAAASQALEAYWGLLDGVCREAGLEVA